MGTAVGWLQDRRPPYAFCAILSKLLERGYTREYIGDCYVGYKGRC